MICHFLLDLFIVFYAIIQSGKSTFFFQITNMVGFLFLNAMNQAVVCFIP